MFEQHKLPSDAAVEIQTQQSEVALNETVFIK